jgi:thiopeptide-type bacteriocin biosynthesis protein
MTGRVQAGARARAAADHGVPAVSSSGFFLMRTPLLPIDDFLAWSASLSAPGDAGDPARLSRALASDRRALRRSLAAIVARPEVREAIFLASPILHGAIDAWLENADSRHGRKVERALVRYFSRMTARATPFGLLAGCSVGKVGTSVHLSLASRARYTRRTRVDMSAFSFLTRRLAADGRLWRELRFFPNSTLYRCGSRYRYVEAGNGLPPSYRLVAIDATPYVDAVLERAAPGAQFAALVGSLLAIDSDLRREDAERFLAELLENEILEPDLTCPLTGSPPLEWLIRRLAASAPTAQRAERLSGVRAAIEALDAGGLGTKPTCYTKVRVALADACDASEDDVPASLQVDMMKPTAGATLSEDILADILHGVRVMHIVGGAQSDGLGEFRERFARRYGEAEVPLCEVLDEEIGLGFPAMGVTQLGAPPFLRDDEAAGLRGYSRTWDPRYGVLMRKLATALENGDGEIVLDGADTDACASVAVEPLPLAFTAMATLAATDEAAAARGAYEILLSGVFGPSGATLLGRLCYMDEDLTENVKAHLRDEEQTEPAAIFAEIVHLPEDGVGNIVQRPVLREYEVPYLGRSGAPPDRQIPIHDLYLTLRRNRLMLISRHHGREIVPRLSSAHNYADHSLPTYHFLCALQTQGTCGGLTWDWGPLDQLPFLPRVRSGRVVLCPARWRLPRDDCQQIAALASAKQYEVIQTWRATRRVPRLVRLVDGNTDLLIDLENVLSVDGLVHTMRSRQELLLTELYPPLHQMPARGPEGRFVHELLLPFVQKVRRPTQSVKPAFSATALRDRAFPPGSSWLFAKLYAEPTLADRLLVEVVRPAAGRAIESGAADCWFYIRYTDPDWHVRVRFRGDSARLQEEVLSQLSPIDARLADVGAYWRLEVDTYDREVERYGGLAGVELAERIFHVDSDFGLTLLQCKPGTDRDRWPVVLFAIDALLSDFGLTAREKARFSSDMYEGYAQMEPLGERLRQFTRASFRGLRGQIEAAFRSQDTDNESWAATRAARTDRTRRLEPVIADLRVVVANGRLETALDDVIASYVHMSINRLLRYPSQWQECALYGCLAAWYRSEFARGQ